MRFLRPLTFAVALLVPQIAPAQEKDDKSLVIVTGKGKEVKAKSWRFTLGTRHLSWLADANEPVPKEPPTVKKGKVAAVPRVGPEYLEIREGLLFQHKEGVSTLVPLSSVRAIVYDKEKKTVAVEVATKAGADQVLRGSTEYVGINKLALEVDIDLGQLGTSKETFKLGDAKDSVTSIRFPAPTPVVPSMAKRPATILTIDKEETKHAVGDLQPLYQVPSGLLRTWPLLYFQKTVKVEFAKLKGLKHAPAEDLKLGTVMQVTLPDGQSLPLTVIEQPKLAEDLPPPRLVGLVGETTLGFKFFPLARVDDLTFQDK